MGEGTSSGTYSQRRKSAEEGLEGSDRQRTGMQK